MRGLEPPRVAPHDPKSCASASSATSAIIFQWVIKSSMTVLWVFPSLLPGSLAIFGHLLEFFPEGYLVEQENRAQ